MDGLFNAKEKRIIGGGDFCYNRKLAPMKNLMEEISTKFDVLKAQVIQPAEGKLSYDYLIPGGYYKQLWDWDGFFIGIYLATRSPALARYLKWWALNFVNATTPEGYTSGCITPKGDRKDIGHFPMKPFLAQGCYFAARYLGDFSWIEPIYSDLERIISYRENHLLDVQSGLFFWETAYQSGADNNPALSNDPNEARSILACDINTFQLREYKCMAKISKALHKQEKQTLYEEQSNQLHSAITTHLLFPKEHSFFNINKETFEPIRCISYSNFIPLIEELAPQDMGRAMINKYLWNHEHMLSKFGLRSLSKQDQKYNNKNIILPYSNWRGPIWPIANYLYSIALFNYGFIDEQQDLAVRLGELCLNDINSFGSMHENYHADTGEPLAPSKDHAENGQSRGFIGWNLLVETMLESAFDGKMNHLEI